MNRFIIGIITFLLTFGISTSLVGLLFGFPELGQSHSSGNHVVRNIQKVLDSDIRYGETRRRLEMRLSYEMKRLAKKGQIGEEQGDAFVAKHAAIIESYADQSSAIDVSHTPADFRYAWKQHMDAWSKEAKDSSARRFGSREELAQPSSQIGSTRASDALSGNEEPALPIASV